MTFSAIDKARAFIVLDHPFFASILLRHPMVASSKVETLSVAINGQITYNPEWFEALPVKQAVFGLCHEVLHYASMHGLRQGSREHEPWNEACDAWVNETLCSMGVGEPISGCVRSFGAHTRTVEAIYDEIMQRPKEDDPNGQGDGQGSGDGEGSAPPKPPKDDPLSDDVEPPPKGTPQGEKTEQEAATKMEVAEAGQAAKMRGNLPALLQQFIADTVDSRVPWYDVLERFMSVKVTNDYSWARPNRRYMPSFYMPTLQGIGAMGEMAVQVDISGSVSRAEIAHYNGHLKRIIEQCNPAKVHVIYTDTEVQHHDEFEAGEEVTINFHSGGGTNMRAGFRYLDDKGIEPICVVTLTDGYTPFPTEAQCAGTTAIWCISSETIKSPTGETIAFSVNE